MIEFVSITLTKPKDSSAWELRVACEQGEDLLPIHLQRLTTVGDFVTSGPLSKAIAFIPEALKAMGIAEAGSEPAYPAQNATEAKADTLDADYERVSEASVRAIKHAIAHGPPDQTTK